MYEKWNILTYDEVVYFDYEISNLGAIRSKGKMINPNGKSSYWRNGTVLKVRHTKKDPHLFTEVSIDKKRKTVYIHKAVYNSFEGQETDYVTHIDRNVLHNYPHNLKSITHSELQIRNMQENPTARMRLSKINRLSGYYEILKGRDKLSDSDIKFIKDNSREGVSVNYIATMIGVSRASVYKYRKINVL